MLFVKGNNGFLFGGGRKVWPPGKEFPPELGIVVNLSVQQHPDGSVFVRKRLVSTFYVDNRESPVPQSHSRTCKNPGIVGSTVAERVVHPLNDLARDRILS